MRSNLRLIIMCGVLSATGACTNVGFVDKAKAAANDEFGVEVFVLGGMTTAAVVGGSFLVPGDVTFTPNCAGVSGYAKANCICQNEASSRQFKGIFRAWLSIAGSADAICNIQGKEIIGCAVENNLGPFYARTQAGNIVLAENYGELSVTGFRQAIDSTQAKLLYTGTNLAGRSTGADCAGFNSMGATVPTAGDQSKSGSGFTSGEPIASCSNGGSFLCMRQQQ